MGVKSYFKKEFQLPSFKLEHETPTDFYVSSFQRNRETLPLLLVRCTLFIGCFAIVRASQILTSKSIGYGLWWIFLSHWGLLMITITSGLAFAVSMMAYLRDPVEAAFGLPWYVKVYWVSYNVTLPIAFFITASYWIFLSELDDEYALNPALDVFVHGINSVLMLILLVSNRHPTRILHFYFAVVAGIIYVHFTVIIHFAGVVGPSNSSAIYPMLDWTQPDVAAGTAVGSVFGILVMHLVVVGLTTARYALTRDCRDNSNSLITNANEQYY